MLADKQRSTLDFLEKYSNAGGVLFKPGPLNIMSFCK